MKMYIKLFIAAVILFMLPTGGLTQLIAFLCVAAGIIILIYQGITEVTNKSNTPKKKKNSTPPWEE